MREEYWYIRCMLAEEFIKYSPCDPDITTEQLIAYQEYNRFKDMGYISDEKYEELTKANPNKA